MKRIFTAGNLPEAYLVRDLLVQAGVPVHIFNQHAMAALGDIPAAAACPQIWLAQLHQEQHARSVIAEYEANRGLGAAQACIACGESNPAGFEICWNCSGAIARLA
jgi:hypothetical protein